VNAIHVEILRTAGRPHWRAARNRIETVTRREGVGVAVTETLVTTIDEAHIRRFRGSPTVLVEGCDVEPRASSTSADFGLG
jgi:hypothetical protein